MARERLDHPAKALTETETKSYLKPFKSSKPVAVALVAIKRLTDEEEKG